MGKVRESAYIYKVCRNLFHHTVFLDEAMETSILEDKVRPNFLFVAYFNQGQEPLNTTVM